ncbi:putative ATPase [Lysinibacter cavernae]|uniref:Putative ATPase n=1 Tax=Lysinibacter cavernae TaxID=1640652 RepID=A0A7X5QZ96_9MICO|nr:putative ATPase [Lysinibacter cavernae]
MTDSGMALGSAHTPLAVRMRPKSLEEVVGQKHLLGPGSPLVTLAHQSDGGESASGAVSIILWGPPGTGKTTLAQAIAHSSGRRFVELSAVTAGVKDVRVVMERALNDRDLYSVSTILFLDEIHRFTKAQQDALLPGVENGWVTLVAATTENPSFSVISPLLSRSLLLTLEQLNDADIEAVVRRAVSDPRGLDNQIAITDEAVATIAQLSSGDARRALTALEAAASSALAEGYVAPVSEVAATADEVGADSSSVDSTDADASGVDANDGHTSAEDATAQDATGEAADGGDTDTSAGASKVTKGRKPRTASGNSKRNKPGNADGPATESISADEVSDGLPLEANEANEPQRVPIVTEEVIARSVNRALLRYDKNGDEHYDVISAFIKSIRGSDPDAAVHYLARMIEAGEDPRFIARRIIVSAAEDIGIADPQALSIAIAAAEATQMIGMPEARIPLSEAVIYLATAPKSNAAYVAIDAAIADVRAGNFGRVPKHLRDGHYAGAKKLGHGVGYRYPHDAPMGVVRQNYLPEEIGNRTYYNPTDHGHERIVAERLEKIRRITRGQ